MITIISFTVIALIITGSESSFNNIINNSLLGDPVVKCGPENINVQASTNFPFEGVVYIKDWRRSPGCFENGTILSGNSDNVVNASSSPHLSVPLHDLSRCGMEMKRQADTGDVVIRGVWVFSFHPMFITKVDRAFAVNCIFKQKDVTVSSKFLVSDLNTKVIGRTSSMPSIGMKIVDGKIPDPRLPQISVVRVGDPVQFLWFLPAHSDIAGIRIKHCTAESRKGNRVQILSDGCSTDRLAISDVTYTQQKDKAYAFANAFKYADNEDMWFKCTVAICMKMPNGTSLNTQHVEDSCDNIQTCDSKRKRVQRSISSDESIYSYKESDDDITEMRLTVLDSYNSNNDPFVTGHDDKRISLYKPRLHTKAGRLVRRPEKTSDKSPWVICMGRRMFALLSSILLVTYITSIIVISISVYVYWRRKNGNKL